jgi:hypothetical protein
VGDILVSAAQPWQILGYADKIQATWDVTAERQPGPAILIKSLGDNAAIGLSANMFDKRTKGSVFLTPFYQRSTTFASLYDPNQRLFPNLPQLNVAFKVGEQKFGLNAFYQVETFNNSRFTPSSDRDYMKSEVDGTTSDVGGCFSARLGLGNLGWNPWVRIGLPILSGKENSTQVSFDSATGMTTTLISSTESKLAGGNVRNLLFNAGSCFDYTFGDRAWAIVGAWYRNEEYKFVKTTTGSATATYSPKYRARYYDYFAAVTPKVFDDFLIGFEYQGAYSLTANNYEDMPRNDTTSRKWYNEIIIAMEKPIRLSHPWFKVFTPRGSLVFNIGRAVERTEIAVAGNPSLIDVREIWTPMRTINYENRDGLLAYLGCGLTIKRATIDLATDVFEWYKQGSMFLGPPPTYVTMTLDFK